MKAVKIINYTVFTFFLLFFTGGCTYIDKKINQKRDYSLYHRRLINNFSDTYCKGEYSVTRIRKEQNDRFILAENRTCMIYLHLVFEHDRVSANTLVISGEKEHIFSEKQLSIEISDINWGNLYTLKNLQNEKIELYMRYNSLNLD